MSSPARRRELARQLDQEYEEREKERRRKASLSMWARIEESDVSEDVKDILHTMAARLGLED